MLDRALHSVQAALIEPPSKNALSYLRVSSKAQLEKDTGDGYSLPAQRAACARKAGSLGATVIEDFVERGESGTTTKRRTALAAMLERVAVGDIDYVIVHKVDRLARRRADDAKIAEAIREYGATLVSVSENIDETPSGMLLHGIMASIAEFYSLNLAAEVKKGTTEKARRGGTPGRPRIGYLNARAEVDGHEVRTVVVDEQRGPFITEAFKLYSTGDYSLSELAAIMEARGVRNRPRRGKPAIPMGPNRWASILRSDYYIGIVRYAGKTYKGKHPKLIDEATFQRVQEVLDAQRQSGERCWRYHSYLRGTLACGECNRRLIYLRAKGNGGTYEYFVCAGKQEGTCSQPHHRVAAVERAVEDEYAKVELSAESQARIRKDVHAQVQTLNEQAEPERQARIEELRRIAQHEKKLLQAHYDDHISSELFAEEQDRLRREKITAEKRLQELQTDHSAALEQLDLALQLTDHIQAAYITAQPTTRRLFNQAIFERIWISRETVEDAQLAQPFHDLLASQRQPDSGRQQGLQDDDRPKPAPFQGWNLSGPRRQRRPGNEKAPTAVLCRGGSNVHRMVRMRGLEPPPGYPDTDLNRGQARKMRPRASRSSVSSSFGTHRTHRTM